MDTVVTPRPTAVFDVCREGDEVVVLYNRAQIAFPAYAEQALRYAVTAPSYKVREIRGNLDDEGRLVLIRRLIREGLLVAKI